MTEISAINCIEVPVGSEDVAVSIRDEYVAYFRTKAGFVSSTFYRASIQNDAINFINIVVWSSQEAYDAVVNEGFSNFEGLNADGKKVLGKGFPAPIVVHPGVYEIIGG
ncbi:MAG: hypothetical protein JKY12_07990 [Sneathiella sp.]|nr:hypothetical protein [Sneathiella sp.]